LATSGDLNLAVDRHVGSVASLGLHQGVAQLYGVRLKGRVAWYLHRVYHLSRMPTTSRKLRIAMDWALAMIYRRDLVALGRLHEPVWRSSPRERADEQFRGPIDARALGTTTSQVMDERRPRLPARDDLASRLSE
jgi:hypothetical protein